MRVCNHCQSALMDTKLTNKVLTNGMLEEEYSETCSICENLVYGYVRRI